MKNPTKSFLLLLLLLLAARAQAQTRRAWEIRVSLEGCKAGDQLSIVLQEDVAIELLPHSGQWRVRREESFNAATEKASLRLHPGRTTCRKAIPGRRNEQGEPIAAFVFSCARRDPRQIELDAGDGVPIAYRRQVPPSPVEKKSVECRELGAFEGSGTISDVELSREKIFVYPGLSAVPRGGWPGILLNDLVKPPDAPSIARTLPLDGLAEVFLEQMAGGDASAQPRMSDNWRLKVKAQLQDLDVGNVAVTVKR